MTMAEKIIAANLVGIDGKPATVAPHDSVLAKVHGGYSHEFTTAQVHSFLSSGIRSGLQPSGSRPIRRL